MKGIIKLKAQTQNVYYLYYQNKLSTTHNFLIQIRPGSLGLEASKLWTMLCVHIHLLSDLAFGGVFHVQWSTRKRSQCPKIIREVCQYLSPPLLRTRNASHTHYCVFSLMVSLTFLYLNHYRHPSTLSIEYEEHTCLKHFQILIQSKQQCLRMTAAVAGERSPICG